MKKQIADVMTKKGVKCGGKREREKGLKLKIWGKADIDIISELHKLNFYLH